MRMTITLRWDEQMALAKVAIDERRKANEQAAVLIRESLEQRGLLLEETSHTSINQERLISTNTQADEAQHAKSTN